MIPANCTYVVILHGHHRTKIGWMRGTWSDKLAQLKNWNVPPSSMKIYINGILPGAFAMRMDRVREATQLEGQLYEQDRQRTDEKAAVAVLVHNVGREWDGA